MVKVAKESRVVHLQKELIMLNMPSALRALNWMIAVMNANNGYARKDGRHYYYHLVDATQDLINHGIKDEVTITACILHDAVEDIPDVTEEYIASEYGYDVARVVTLVTKREGIDYKDGKNLQIYLNNILYDCRACLVKTADRKHNFSTLFATSKKHELRQTKETEQYFLPFFKSARNMHPLFSSYFHSAKTTIMPHLNRIKQAYTEEERLLEKIKMLEESLESEKKRGNALENKMRKEKKKSNAV